MHLFLFPKPTVYKLLPAADGVRFKEGTLLSALDESGMPACE